MDLSVYPLVGLALAIGLSAGLVVRRRRRAAWARRVAAFFNQPSGPGASGAAATPRPGR